MNIEEQYNELIKNITHYKYYILGGFILLVLLLVFGFYRIIVSYKTDAKINQQNIEALISKTRQDVNELGQKIYSRPTTAMEYDELLKANKDLAKEIKALKGEVFTISSIVSEFDGGTSVINNNITQVSPMEYDVSWKYKKDTLNFLQNIVAKSSIKIDTTNHSLKITDKGTTLLQNDMKFKLYTGLIKNSEGIYETVVRTDYPNIKFDIESNIDPDIVAQKKKRWGVGFILGGGLSSVAIGIPQPSIGLGVSLGIGISYDVFSW